ncbi:MAG: glycosyltransferase family 4 protein [bacterium]|nr:glycosyltransferase family 4 protein [bacterium]
MKVLYLVSGIGPPAGWGTEFIQNLIFALSQKGVEATIINPIYKHTHPDWKTWTKEVEKKYKVRIISLEAPGWIKERLLLHFALTPLFVTLTAIKLLRKEKFDLIHEFSSTPIILLRSSFLKALFHTPIVFTLSVYNNTILGKLFWIKLLDFAEIYLLPSRDIIAAVKSLGIKDQKIAYCPPGMNLDRFHKTVSRADAREKLQLPINKFIFSYFGSLTKEKGVLDLVEAAKLVKREVQKEISIILFAVWKGSGQHQKIKEEIESLNLSYLKLVEKYVDIPTLLAASDAVILPQQTGHGTTIPPISIIETLASGKPLITTGILGVKESLNSNNHILIPPRDPSSIAHAMETVFRQRSFSVFENRRVLTIFEIKKSVSLHLKVYEALLLWPTDK